MQGPLEQDRRSSARLWLRRLAVAGNVVYILWITYNAIDGDGGAVRPVEAVALSGLMVLLVLNAALLWPRSR